MKWKDITPGHVITLLIFLTTSVGSALGWVGNKIWSIETQIIKINSDLAVYKSDLTVIKKDVRVNAIYRDAYLENDKARIDEWWTDYDKPRRRSRQ